MKLKNKIVMILTFILSVSGMFAMPGFSSFVNDSSGEFVYYRDNSFPEETYIGILYYSDDSIQIRYYRPLNKEKMIPEKEVSILFALDPDSDHLEFTGELIMSTILPNTNDLDIVNYLHDFLYEFSSRRIKENIILPYENAYKTSSSFYTSGKRTSQSFEQFGGSVILVYDPLIPIFNLKSILNEKNEPLLTCVTFGILQNSSDSTFDDFIGFPQSKNFKSEKKSSVNTKAKSNDFKTNDGQYITLDANWSQAMDNLWLCGNEALLTINTIPSINNVTEGYDLTVTRKILQSSSGSYTNLNESEIIYDSKNNSYKISQISYQPKTENTIFNKKIITKNVNTNSFYYCALTVFNDYYLQNVSYYDKLLKSYKIKN